MVDAERRAHQGSPAVGLVLRRDEALEHAGARTRAECVAHELDGDILQRPALHGSFVDAAAIDH